jgi:hypothetical protein
MRTKHLLLVVFCALLFSQSHVNAAEEYGWRFASTTVDIFIARPFTFAATVVGGAIWAIALPITAPTHTSEEALDALVKQPWGLTIDRPLGDFGE